MRENRKKIQSVLRILLITAISVIFGFGIYRWNAQSLTGNIMPMPFGVGVGVVMSGSMEPELSVDDVIFVVASDEYEVDDVVVFQQKNMLVVHKIIEIDGDTVTTQGTANNTPDEPMNVSVIKGKVLFHIDGLGGAITWLKSPMGTILILAVAGLLLVQSYAQERKEKDQQDEKIDEIKREIEKLKQHREESEASSNNEGGVLSSMGLPHSADASFAMTDKDEAIMGLPHSADASFAMTEKPKGDCAQPAICEEQTPSDG